MPVKGQARKALVHFDRNGFAYTLDRGTGEVLLAQPFVPMNWAKYIHLQTGRPEIDTSKKTKQGKLVKNICLSLEGGKKPPTAAFSPQSGLITGPRLPR